VVSVQVIGQSGTTISWSALGGAVSYDVVSWTLGSQVERHRYRRLSGEQRRRDEQVDGPEPAANDGYYYLVRAQNASCPGTWVRFVRTWAPASAGVRRSPDSASFS
jgi:hypothetical protein